MIVPSAPQNIKCAFTYLCIRVPFLKLASYRKPFFVITALSEQDGRSYWSAMRAPLLRQGCSRLPVAGSSLPPSVVMPLRHVRSREDSCVSRCSSSWQFPVRTHELRCSWICLHHHAATSHCQHSRPLHGCRERVPSSQTSAGMRRRKTRVEHVAPHRQTGLDLPVHTGLNPVSTMTCTMAFLQHQMLQQDTQEPS